MKPVRMVGLLALTVIAAGACSSTRAANTEAARAAGVWVQVSPASARPGSPVTIRADCKDSNKAATVQSDAFSAITMVPDGSALRATTNIAQRTQPGTYQVILTCRNGARSTTPLTVLGRGAATAPAPAPAPASASASASAPTPTPKAVQPSRATLGPHTGGGFLARGDGTRSDRPGSDRPGSDRAGSDRATPDGDPGRVPGDRYAAGWLATVAAITAAGLGLLLTRRRQSSRASSSAAVRISGPRTPP